MIHAMKRIIIMLMAIACASAQAIAAYKFPGKKSEWNGCDRYDFKIDNRDATVVVPENALPGNPWVWRPAFFDAFPDIDRELLKLGFHITYFDTTNEWGRPEALAAAEKYYDFMVGEHKMMADPVMEGLSRGGYFSLRWAQTHPDKVGLLLLDNPLVDILALEHDSEFMADFLSKWGMESAAYDTFRDNAVYNMTPLVDHRIPLVLLSGGADTVVPYEKHGRILVDVYRRWGVPYKSIVRPGGGHHPHGSDHADVIAGYIMNVVCNGAGSENRKIRVASIGDSVTEGVGTTDASRYSYSAVLQGLLGEGYEVRNFGVSCATVLKKGTDSGRPFSYMGTQRFRDALKWAPDVVIIKLGGNDSKPDNYRYVDELKHNYQELIDAFKYLPSLPQIFICLPVKGKVTDPDQMWGINDTLIRDGITPCISEVAHDNRIPAIPLRDVYDGEENTCFTDNIHPSDRGAYLLGRRIYSVVESYLKGF